MNKMSFNYSTTLALVLLLVFASHITQGFADESIRIGVVTGLTGWGADLGASAKEGVNLAVEEINNSGGLLGKDVEVIFQQPSAVVNFLNG